jgi:hypothetical protein
MDFGGADLINTYNFVFYVIFLLFLNVKLHICQKDGRVSTAFIWSFNEVLKMNAFWETAC